MNDTVYIGNAARSTSDTVKIFASIFSPDTVPPTIVNITLDLGLDMLIVLIDEPMKLTGIDMTAFHLQSATSSPGSLRRLTSISTVTVRGHSLTINFGSADQSYIQLQSSLANSIVSSYIAVFYHAATDISGNYLTSISSSSARQVDAYILSRY